MINFTILLDQGLLHQSDLVDRPTFPVDKVDFASVIPWKIKVLDRAYERYRKSMKGKLKTQFLDFQSENTAWLDEFALFMAIKDSFGGVGWNDWPDTLRLRYPKELQGFIAKNPDLIERQKFRQFLFFQQWILLKQYANSKKIRIIGDIPIFVAFDSCDSWSHPELFYFDKNRNPLVVAGVPPDYFSPTGQLWGNPIYRWSAHEKTGFSWWIERTRTSLKMYDVLRLDHFRGFASYWEIPAKNKTAEIGRWVRGPGSKLFNAVKDKLGALPIIAEDLGLIDPEVFKLRDQFDFPGMKILQFAFASDAHDPFLPHNYPENCVAYTGTHDNDTTVSWYQTAPENEKDHVRRYLGRTGEDISWDMIRAIWSSVAKFVLAPMQDLLSLGNAARMNFPNTMGGNWQWRIKPDDLNEYILGRLKEMNELYGRSHL